MPRQYRQYLRDLSLNIPESTRRYRATRESNTSRSPAKRQRRGKTCETGDDGRRIDASVPSTNNSGQPSDFDHKDNTSVFEFPSGVSEFSESSTYSDTAEDISDLSDVQNTVEDSTGDLLTNTFDEEDKNDGQDPNLASDEDITSPNGTYRNGIRQPSETLHPNTDVTRGQFFLLSLAFITRHKLCGLALTDFLQLMNYVMPDCLPKSHYLWNKLLISPGGYTKHFYCDKCNVYFGEKAPDVCENCGGLSEEKCKFFLTMSIGKQVEDLSTNHSHFDIIHSRDGCSHQQIQDVSCGKIYQRKQLRQILNGKHNISLSWSCDGVPIFSSSKYSIWPVMCTINELPYHLCRDHTLLYSIWFGKSKPNITSYLQPFVDELRILVTEGVKWIDSEGRSNTTRVISGVCSCDTVARAMLQNFTQFNGQHGCSFCLHPGETVEKGRGHVRIYPILPETPILRTNTSTIADAENTVKQDTPINGVKGPSVLMLLPHFDVIKGFSPDYMHSVLLGVVRHTVYLWLEPSQHTKPFYLGIQRLEELNNRLLQIRSPREIRRAPRTLIDRKYWKASEWRNFLLIYSPVILRDILSKEYYHHWLLVLTGGSLLMGISITAADLTSSKLCFLKFVSDFSRLYGREVVSFNIHLLTHLSESVENQGPLWATSTFVFEDAYGKLQTLFHGTQHVPEQMFKSFFISRELSMLANIYLPDASEDLRSLYNKISSTNPSVKATQRTGSFTGLGAPVCRKMSVAERPAVLEFTGGRITTEEGTYFNRFITKGKLYTTDKYSQPYRRDDSTVLVTLFPKKVCTIKEAVVLKSGNESIVCLLVQPLSVTCLNCFDSYVERNLAGLIFRFQPCPRPSLVACSPDSLAGKFVVISKTYAVKLPTLELD